LYNTDASKAGSAHAETPAVREGLAREWAMGLDDLAIYSAFTDRVTRSCESLRSFLAEARAAGKTVAARGASTKGNVLLQYCGLGPADLVAISEVNEEKFGCVTPGTLIPIRPEAEVKAQEPDLLALPCREELVSAD
jgi:hypothetical protein